MSSGQCAWKLLVCQGYWDLFEEKVLLENKEGLEVKRIKKRMAEAKATLILSVEDAQLAHITDPNPYTIWDNLAKAKPWRPGLEKSALLPTALLPINISTSDKDIIVVLTASLPPSYETVIISLDAIKPEELTLNFVITCLLNEESCQNLTCTTTTATTLKSGEKPGLDTMTATKKTGSTVTCFYCGGIGHFTASCKTRLKHFKLIDEKFAGFAVFPEDDKENYAL
ncbi:hypothetical protein H2248_001983 [Termitomyces sp. 'cryptogamus']|nr:hypothetical protein H2248_001983 [Termitomyces sp. 'cryptogamus']